MKTWTGAELITKVEAELDMSDQLFLSSIQEKLDYINEGVLNLERIIHTLHLDYFKRQYFFPVVAGTLRYAFPADAYGHYIRQMFYLDNGVLTPASGGSNYEIVKVEMMQIPLIESSDDYMYDVENVDAATGAQIVFYPAPRETTSVKFMMFYIRQANRLMATSDLVDIPEGELYMFHFLRMKYLAKDKGNPLFDLEVAALDREELAFRSAMAAMAPANSNGKIEADYSFYEEMY